MINTSRINLANEKKVLNDLEMVHLKFSSDGIRTVIGARVSERSLIDLRISDVDLDKLSPQPELVEQIASLIDRKGKVEIPGYALIPNTISIFGSRENAVNFQINTMLALKDYLKTNRPDSVTQQTYSEHQSISLTGNFDTLGVEAFQFSAYDGRAVQTFHLDNLRQSYVSLIYGPNYNIHGGIPCLFDALSLKESLRIDFLQDIIKLDRLKASYTEVHTPHDLEGALHDQYQFANFDYIIPLNFIDSLELPMLIFSNRFENGLLHGATPPTTLHPEQSADRPISYVAIKHFPFTKTGSFKPTHKMFV